MIYTTTTILISILLSVIAIAFGIAIIYIIMRIHAHKVHIKVGTVGDTVKFYINKTKHIGVISNRINIADDKRVQIKYVNGETGKEEFHYCNIIDTYPI